jgi:hypothetical protein
VKKFPYNLQPHIKSKDIKYSFLVFSYQSD